MNLKKLTQKDRYGNMVSFEFDVPPMESIPHPGMPIGTDTVPAWLTPGERVMNAEAERMYGPALEKMNEHGRAIQRAQGGTIPEYAAMGCKVNYKAAGGPVYAQQGMSPEQMSALLAQQVLMGQDPRTAEAALVNMGMGKGQAQAVIPSFAQPQVPPTDYEAEALMGVREYPQVPTTPQTLNTELPPIRPQQVPTPTDYEGDIFAGRREYPQVQQTPGQLSSEPPQKVEDRAISTRSLLLDQEGMKNTPYKDTEGFWTVGVGHRITDPDTLKRLNNGESVSYTDDQLMQWFEKDISTATEGAKKNFDSFNSYSPKLQDALVSMNFQLGTEGTRKFKDFRAALAKGDYETAKAELDDSDWAKQTPTRVEYLKSVIDKEAAGKVGNKNTITSTSGQPVVDSRFGVESTYNPEQPEQSWLSRWLSGETPFDNPMIGASGDFAAAQKVRQGTTTQGGRGNLVEKAGERAQYTPVQGGRGNIVEEAGARAQAAGVPPIGEDLSIPEQFREWAFGDKRSLIDRWDSDMTVPENVRNFVTGDPRSLPERVEGNRILDNILNDTPEKRQARRDNFTLRDDALAVKENKLLQELDVLEGQKQGRVGGATVPRPEQEIQKELAKVRQTRNQLKTGLVSGMDGPEEDELQVTPPSPPEVPEASEGADISAKPKTPTSVPNAKADAAKVIEEQTKGEETPTATPEDVEKKGNEQSDEAKSKAQSFFEEWGLADLFDKKEIGRMVAMYLGSRALGYSHGGSLNFAAKNYAQRIQQKATTEAASQAKRAEKVVQMVADGKISPKAAEMYKRTGNLAYLDSGLSKGVPKGGYEDFYSNGTKVRARKVELPNGSVVYQTEKGQVLDSSYHQDSWRVKGTKEYIDRRDSFIQNNKSQFEDKLDLAKGDEKNVEWTSNMSQLDSATAAAEYWDWVARTNRDPESTESLTIMGEAYQRMLNDAKKGNLKIKSLVPYLNGIVYQEETNMPEMFIINPEEVKEGKAYPEYVDQQKMSSLLDNTDLLVRKINEVRKSKNQPLISRQDIFNTALDNWEQEKDKYGTESSGGKSPESPFYMFMQDQLQLGVSNFN